MAPYFVAAGILVAVAVYERRQGPVPKSNERILSALFVLVLVFGAVEMWRQTQDDRPPPADCFDRGGC